jgi:hypothetical protein
VFNFASSDSQEGTSLVLTESSEKKVVDNVMPLPCCELHLAKVPDGILIVC